LTSFYESRGEHHTALEIGKRLYSMAEHTGVPLLVAGGHIALAMINNYLGEFAQSLAHLKHVIASYDPQRDHAMAILYGPDFGVASLSYVSTVSCLLGYPEQGLKHSQEAIALAQELSHPHSLTLAHGVAGWFHVFRLDAQAAQEHAEACLCLSTEHGFPYMSTMAHIIHGWALSEQGQVEEGIVEIRQGTADHEATGAKLGQPHHLAVLAQACGKAGQIEEGLVTLAEALEVTIRTDERWCEAKLHRLRGEFLLMQDADVGEVEACFQEAIEVARQQQAKMFELRAVMSLCRLWQEQGKREDARQMLSEIYDWFTEGFDTPDLVEAQTLLAELS
jgi:predicted ATPase